MWNPHDLISQQRTMEIWYFECGIIVPRAIRGCHVAINLLCQVWNTFSCFTYPPVKTLQYFIFRQLSLLTTHQSQCYQRFYPTLKTGLSTWWGAVSKIPSKSCLGQFRSWYDSYDQITNWTRCICLRFQINIILRWLRHLPGPAMAFYTPAKKSTPGSPFQDTPGKRRALSHTRAV